MKKERIEELELSAAKVLEDRKAAEKLLKKNMYDQEACRLTRESIALTNHILYTLAHKEF